MNEGDKDKDGVLNREEFYEIIKSGCDISDKLTIRFWLYIHATYYIYSKNLFSLKLKIGCDNAELATKSIKNIYHTDKPVF